MGGLLRFGRPTHIGQISARAKAEYPKLKNWKKGAAACDQYSNPARVPPNQVARPQTIRRPTRILP